MKTETYLQGARDLKFLIEQLEAERREILDTMVTIKSTSDYSDRVQTSPQGDSLERKVIEVLEKLERLDRRLIKKVYALTIRRDNIRKKVCGMKEGQSRRFLIDYYINCKSWDQIFDEYHIEPDYHIKRRAIRDLEKMERAHKLYSENTVNSII